ncbi:MAG TPA: ABC transporter substrate-binding protein [Egibacteraceae bacterium]|jgi:peptide/nickel transport system substrate-binding protein|nr:ABC transporter substrate-binding protein [Egibacteraceae bacterium]
MSRTLCLLLALALAITACDAGEPTEDEIEDDAAGEPEAGGDLSVGWIQDEYVQEGTGANVGMYPLNTNVYETLIRLTPEYELEPLLAEDWEFVEPNTWRFHLRQDVTFHNGEPMNAEAVKEGLFDRVAADGGGTIRAGEDSVEIVDEYTLDFTPTEENRRVAEQIVHPNNSVVAPGTMPDGEEVVGTGPFRFSSYRSGEEISVERNTDYWGDEPALDSITFRFFPEDSSRLLALEADEIDLACETPRDDVAGLRDAGFEIAESEVGAYRALFLNIHGDEPNDILQDEAVRKAVAMGIDRESIVEDVLNGLATTDQTLVPPHVLGDHADRIDGFEYDPEAASDLLEEAGWEEGPDGTRERDGRDLSLTVVSGFGGAELHRPVPSVLQSQLAQIGIDLKIDERPDSAAYQEVIETGEADLYLEQGSQNDGNPAFLPVLLFYTGGEGATAPYQSLFAPGDEFDERIEPVLTAVDQDEVQEATAEALSYLIDDQAVVLPFAGIYRIVAHDSAVEGFVAHPSTLHTQWAPVSIGG